MRCIVSLLLTVLPFAPVRAGEEQDRFEEQAMARCAQHKAERLIRVGNWERANTVRDLEAAFPGKLPKTEFKKDDDEAAAWFTLVAGTADEWRKSDAAAAGLAPMFDRWKQRLELGPVPSIKRDEFTKFAKLIIRNAAQGMAEGGGDTSGEADKVFRALDLNSDGELTGTEMSTGLREDKAQADTNGDGRISKDEYREYFKRRTEGRAEKLATAIKSNQALMRELEGGGKRAGLPDWFTKLDADQEGQVSLFSWRKAGRPTAEFQEMDLNGDGLITADEYHRWAKQKGKEGAHKKREEKEKKREGADPS
ncbi:EF-hand domain-containing protein [Frigoriglobus tundricola]|uniref:EF-hand domain-containing protein n=1 Tax=Frigoriglobus tundricola TaxID=2774151 RepID=A0A6M5Z1D5_9BACT|nr:EF-hand domain-containing protein [Frigoriglobus tundricola]QJX00218.1 hypothetical protein FTUN_7842 [Frigoriglobus tundricola]